MRIHLSERVPRVPPHRALAWWSDFQEGGTDHAFLPGEKRRILSRIDGEVTMEDRFLLFRETTTARVDGNAVRFRGRNNVSAFDGAYVFQPDGDGTRIDLDVEVRLRRGLAWSEPAAQRIARRIIANDLRHHAEDLAREA